MCVDLSMITSYSLVDYERAACEGLTYFLWLKIHILDQGAAARVHRLCQGQAGFSFGGGRGSNVCGSEKKTGTKIAAW